MYSDSNVQIKLEVLFIICTERLQRCGNILSEISLEKNTEMKEKLTWTSTLINRTWRLHGGNNRG